jgi:hypothetical protein
MQEIRMDYLVPRIFDGLAVRLDLAGNRVMSEFLVKLIAIIHKRLKQSFKLLKL